MSYLFDYGEFLICIAPIFIIIAAVGLLLLANSWPPKRPEVSDDRLVAGDEEK